MRHAVLNEVESLRESLTTLSRQEANNRRLLIDLQHGQEALEQNLKSSLRDFRFEEDKRIVNYVKKYVDTRDQKERRLETFADEKARRSDVHGRVGVGGGSYSIDRPAGISAHPTPHQVDVENAMLPPPPVRMEEDSQVPTSVLSKVAPPRYPPPRATSCNRGGKGDGGVKPAKEESKKLRECDHPSDPNLER